jgi:hypothetical protein
MTITAMCLDARGLMRSGSAYAAVKDKKAKDVAETILNKYSPLITAKELKLDDLAQEINLTQAGGDLDYICAAAGLRGLSFYIDCGKAVAAKPGGETCVTFDWEQFEMELKVRYLDENLTAYGYDAANMTAFSSKAAAKSAAKQAKLLTVERASRLPRYIGAEAAKASLDGIAKARAAACVSGVLTCAGLPEVKLGQSVKINKFPMTALGVADILAVVSLRHEISAETGFTTQIGVEGV